MNNDTTTMNHTPTDCQALAAGICRRLHVGDVVRVVGGSGQTGYMQYGTVTDQPHASHFTVHFPDGVPVLHNDVVLDTLNDLTYEEAELEKVSV